MATKHMLSLPVSKQQIFQIKTGDLVYLTGTICTGRDHFHKRVIEMNHKDQKLPTSFNLLKGGAIYHMGPIVKKNAEGSYTIVSGGPTTSARMNPFQTEVCEILECPIIIGKGGMDGVKWENIPAVYLHYPGGAGAIVSKFVQNVLNVEWLDLGSPEAAWFLEVKDFGPLVATIDAQGGNFYKNR
jgi:fumarate hydratase subunit beta